MNAHSLCSCLLHTRNKHTFADIRLLCKLFPSLSGMLTSNRTVLYVASQPVTCAYDSHLLLPCLRMTHALQRRRLLSSLFLRWLLCLSPTSSWDGCRKANGWGSSSPILMSDRPSGLYQYRQLLMYVNEHYRIFFASLLHNVLVFSSDCLTNTAASSSLLRKPSNPENDMLQAILVSTHTSHKLTQFAGSLRWFTFNRRFT